MKQMTFRVLMRHTREQHRRTWAVVRVPGDATAKEVRDATCFAIVDRGANTGPARIKPWLTSRLR